jgi:multisubunit Na+/H+ antiporter MnhE subunit
MSADMSGRRIPHWLAWPILALSTLIATAGALLVFYAAANGEYTPAVLAVGVYVVAAILWYLADIVGRGGAIS